VIIQINGHTADFELENERTARDVAESVTHWVKERNLILMEVQIDGEPSVASETPDTPLDAIDTLNFIVQSQADVVISSLNEGIGYCDRALRFIARATEDAGARPDELERLAAGIDWMVSLLDTVLQVLAVAPADVKYRDATLEEYKMKLASLRDDIAGGAGTAITETLEAGRERFEAFRNIFRMILMSDNLQTLVATSIESPDALVGHLRDVRAGLPAQVQNLEDIAAAFQGGRDAEGAEKLNGFIDFMYTYIRTCHQIPPIFRIDLEGIILDGTSLEDINADLTEKLNMIVEVMENNDIISLTDILEYEIKPAFEGLGRYIDELLKAL